MNLPGILSDRFFKIIAKDLHEQRPPTVVPVPPQDDYIDQKEFMKAMFRVYYSPLETKFKLVFDMYGCCMQFSFRYDFDGDGQISKEDIHLMLSHIPMSVS
jgi:hypothetical protein